ncbi:MULTISPECIES: hypothetical protein [Streptomyces]|uniref:Uncharacterized protein n=1 Tax=Streptomyces achmelvichensis TaxID=3134111 RepID=A0ACC6Q5Y4_9ACTN|nr:hypothetical protein OG317_31205 [Streptomyces sp. NBC_01167]
MSTTRHLINRRRRLATTGRPGTAPGDTLTSDRPATATATAGGPARRPAVRERGPGAPEELADVKPAAARGSRLLAVLCALVVLSGGFAAFAGAQASDLRDEPAVRNAALADTARTSELKGRVTTAVEALFSYNFADPGGLDRAVKEHLTGKAVAQHAAMLAAVRKEGPRQKLVLTTTVTESGVELIDGDRARVLVFADQSNTRTATKGETTYAAAMLAVEAVRSDGTWRLAALDTFGEGA